MIQAMVQFKRRRGVALVFLTLGAVALMTIFAESPVPAAEGNPEKSWDIAAMKVLTRSTPVIGGAGFSAWKRQHRNGAETWITANKSGSEVFRVRAKIISFETRIATGNQNSGRRFFIVAVLLTQTVMKHGGEKPPKDFGARMVKLTKQAAASPGQEVSEEMGAFKISLKRAQGENLWTYTVARG